MVQAIVINGLIFGGIYAVLAIGFSLVFGVARILNMAHTAFYMVAAYIILTGTVVLGLPLLPSIILAVVITSGVGMCCYKLSLDPVKEHGIVVLIVSLALALVFQEVFFIIFTGRYRGISSFVPGFVELAGVRVLYQHVFTIGAAAIIVIGMMIFLSKARFGKAIRAIADDREVANLMGINVSQANLITVGISAGLAAVAGAVVAPLVTVEPVMWMSPLIMVLAAVILGGLGSIKGSVMGAFILGFTETFVVFLVPMGSYLRGAVSLAIMVIVLLVRPEGLSGVVFEEERL